MNSTVESPIERVQQPRLVPFLSDVMLSLVSPILLYWVYSLFFHFISIYQIPIFERYRIHDTEEQVKNKITISELIRGVIVQQILQTIIGILVIDNSSAVYIGDDIKYIAKYVNWISWAIEFTGIEKFFSAQFDHRLPALIEGVAYLAYWYILPTCRIITGMFILDTYQYFLHRAFHANHFLYKHIHSHHHRLYVPYAFGAIYNHPIEGFAMDTVSGALGFFLSGMTTRESMIFFSFSTIKTVDDHSGYSLPWDPFQATFYNNVSYHDIHHQPLGGKKNYSQPFFTIWDRILGTYAPIDIIAGKFKKKQNREAEKRRLAEKQKKFMLEEKEREEANKKLCQKNAEALRCANTRNVGRSQ